MTELTYDEMKKIVSENLCAECNGVLTIRTNPETYKMEVWCPHHPDHHGYLERTSYTEDMRRGVTVHPNIQRAIEQKMLPKDNVARAFNLLALRYPAVIKDQATAALFLVDCQKLDLDPMIQPSEAVPIAFTSHRDNKTTISMIITSDGWLSMAARGCPDDWIGPPKTIRLEEYLASLPENRERTWFKLDERAKSIKKSDCGDPEAWYYIAIGKRRNGEDCQSPGWFTHDEQITAAKNKLPAGDNPGNQARRRAIKHWVRDVFPECRQKMIEVTTEWMQRSEGIQEAQTYIDAEYSIISSPLKTKKVLLQEGERTLKENREPVQENGVTTTVGNPDFEPWLKETLKAIHWDEETAKSWIGSQFKGVDNTGLLKDVIARLDKTQVEKFCKHISSQPQKKLSI